MIISKADLNPRMVIDLTGPSGNAFAILGLARRLARDYSLDFEEIRTEMTSGDYEHLIYVFDRYFGEYVDLAR